MLLEFLIPTYKRPSGCLNAVSSILSQCSVDHANTISISIVDDATPGLHLDDLKLSISRINPGIKVRIAQNPFNFGMSANIYEMVKKVNAQYWSVLTDDDIIKDRMLAPLIDSVLYASSNNIGSIMSTRDCHHENGKYLFKACSPFKKYPLRISCGPLNAIQRMRNGHILTGMIIEKRFNPIPWELNIDNAYFPVIIYGVSLLSSDSLFVDSGCFSHTVHNHTHWERWGKDKSTQAVRLFSDFWGAQNIVFREALKISNLHLHPIILIYFMVAKYDYIRRVIRQNGRLCARSYMASLPYDGLVSYIVRLVLFRLASAGNFLRGQADRFRKFLAA